MRLNWTPEAQSDYRKVIEYLVDNWTDAVVHRFIDNVDAVERVLTSNPLAGHREPLLEDMPQDYRSIKIDGVNRLVYLVLDDIIWIVRLWDMRRNSQFLINQVR